jgi:type IV pilus assembly protein PilO
MALTMPKTQREQALVLVGFLGLAAAGLYYMYAYSPKAAELTVAEAKLDTLEDNNRKAKAMLSAGTTNELREQIDLYTGNLQIMRQLVPTSNEVPALLDQVSTAARRAGLDIGKFEPIGPEQGTSFDAYRYRWTVTGSYHGVASFLTNVGTLERIIIPHNIVMTASTTQPVNPEKAVSMQFELHTYVIHSEPQRGSQ